MSLEFGTDFFLEVFVHTPKKSAEGLRTETLAVCESQEQTEIPCFLLEP